MDCPRCEVKLQGLMKLKKHERIRLQRRFQGLVTTTVKGDTRSQTTEGLGRLPPDGMRVTEHCRSCGWTSIRTYDQHNRRWNYEVI